MSEGGKEAVRADDEVVRGIRGAAGSRSACASSSGCSAARPWRSRSSRRRSTWRGQKNRSCCRARRRRTIPGEDGRRHARRCPIEHRRTARTALGRSAGRRPGRAISSWPPRSGAWSTRGQPTATGGSPRSSSASGDPPAQPRQCQARLSADEEARSAARPPHRAPAAARARRPGRHDPLEHPLVLRCAGVHLLERRDRARRLRPRLP